MENPPSKLKCFVCNSEKELDEHELADLNKRRDEGFASTVCSERGLVYHDEYDLFLCNWSCREGLVLSRLSIAAYANSRVFRLQTLCSALDILTGDWSMYSLTNYVIGVSKDIIEKLNLIAANGLEKEIQMVMTRFCWEVT